MAATQDPTSDFLLALPLIQSNSADVYEVFFDGGLEVRTEIPKTSAELEDEAAGVDVQTKYKIEYPQRLTETQAMDLLRAMKGNTHLKKVTLRSQTAAFTGSCAENCPAIAAMWNSLDQTQQPPAPAPKKSKVPVINKATDDGLYVGPRAGLTYVDLCNNPALLCDDFFEEALNFLREKNHTIVKFNLLADGQTEDEHVLKVNEEQPRATAGMIDLITYVSHLNKFPIQLKSNAYRARANDTTLFSLELRHDDSDVDVYTEDSTRAIVQALEENNTVRTLKLDRCCPDVKCIRILAEGLVRSSKHLTKLSLADNRLTPEAALDLSSAIALNPQTQLEELNLSDNPLLDDEACDSLTDLLKTNDTLRKVSVDGKNRVSTDAANRLRCAAAFNCEPPKLKHMISDLKRNDASCTVVELQGTPMLPGKPGKGYYTNLGARTLAEVLAVNTQVHTIDFSHNHIGPDGAASLGAYLRGNPHITSLDMSHNPLQDEGLKHLLIALTHNDALSTCGVAGCESSEKLVNEVQAVCRLNSQPLPIKELLKTSVPFTRADLRRLGMNKGDGQDAEVDPEAPMCLDLRTREQPLGKWPMLRASSAPFLMKILKNHPEFTELNLTGNRTFGDKGVDQLCEEHICCGPGQQSSSLTKISLIDTGITDTSLHSLAVAVRTNYKLTSIVCVGNPDLTTRPVQMLDDTLSLNHHAPPVKDIVPLLRRNTDGITDIRFGHSELRGAPLGDDTVKLICDALSSNDKVTLLDLSGQDISNRGCGYLCDLLTDQSAPRAVNAAVMDIPQDHRAEDKLEATVGSNAPSSHVTAATTATTSRSASKRRSTITTPYKGNVSITSLDISCNGIGPDGAKQLAFMLEHNSSIRTLRLHRNRLQDHGVQELLRALRMSNKCLTALTVNDTEANANTQREVSAIVAYNSQQSEFRFEVLERLGLLPSVVHTGSVATGVLDSTSVTALYSGLLTHPTHNITSIELTNNKINLEGVQTLCTILKENNKIDTLILKDNNPGNPMHTLTDGQGDDDNDTSVSQSVAGSGVQALRGKKKQHGARSLTRPWIFTQVSEELYRCVEECPWLKKVVVEEEGISVLSQEVHASISLNNQTHNFRAFYRRVRDGGKDKDNNLIVPQAIDLVSQDLTEDSLRLLFENLLARPQDLAKIRLLNLNGNNLDDAAIQYLCTQLDRGRAPLLQSLYLDNNPIGCAALDALREFAWSSPDLCVVSTRSTPAETLVKSHDAIAAREEKGESGATGQEQRRIAAEDSAEDQDPSSAPISLVMTPEIAAAGTAFHSIESKLQANKEKLGPEKALVMTMSQRRVKASTGNPFKSSGGAKKSLNPGEVDVDTMLAAEAYTEMPKRQPYFRGKFLPSKN